MESTELQLYSLPKTAGELEAAFISGDYTDRLIEEIRAKAKSVVGDINTAKGRKAYISMAATVRSSKVAIDDAGKTLVAEMKKRPALVDASRRKIREALDALAIEIRQPVTDWEAEQERIKAEEALAAAHAEALEMNAVFDKAAAERFESDHEIALLMNDKFDRDRAEAARLAEQQRIEHEQRIAREAEERVKREAEEKAKRDHEETERRERELQAAAEREKQQRIEAQQLAERQAREAREKAEHEKQEPSKLNAVKQLMQSKRDWPKRSARLMNWPGAQQMKTTASALALNRSAHWKVSLALAVNRLSAHLKPLKTVKYRT
ncbi:hypothetical protein JK223_06460 [Tatumella sp. JGM118]|nr:hypothetical protein [Tatumella sp. JGM118]MBS0909172.1 hypothetical protein [Tatumella sp. JGM118]